MLAYVYFLIVPWTFRLIGATGADDFQKDLFPDHKYRIEATPVLIQRSTTPSYSLGWTRKVAKELDFDSPPEGSGRDKRDYNLEDFLIWTPSGDGPLEQFNKNPTNKDWTRSYTRTVYVTTTKYATVTIPPNIRPAETQKNVFPTKFTDFGKSFSNGIGSRGWGGCQNVVDDAPVTAPTENNGLFFPEINEEAIKSASKSNINYFPTPSYPMTRPKLDDTSLEDNYHKIKDFLHPSLGYEGHEYTHTEHKHQTPTLKTADRTKEIIIRNTRRTSSTKAIVTPTKTFETEKTTMYNQVTEESFFQQPTTFVPEIYLTVPFRTKQEARTESSKALLETTEDTQDTTLPEEVSSAIPPIPSTTPTTISSVATTSPSTATSPPSSTSSTISFPTTLLTSTDKMSTSTRLTTDKTTQEINYSTDEPLTETSTLVTSIDVTNSTSTKTTIASPTSSSPAVNPSPSNNLTVPLDKIYWTRTVIKGKTKTDNKLLFKNEIVQKLTTVYQNAYERSMSESVNQVKRKRRYLSLIRSKSNFIKRLEPSVIHDSRRRLLQEQNTFQTYLHHPSRLPSESKIRMTRKRREVPTDVSVRMQNITYYENLNMTELIYTVFMEDSPVRAVNAVQVANKMNLTEMEEILDYTLAIQAEEYLKDVPMLKKSTSQHYFVIFGSVIGTTVIIVIIIAIGCIVKAKIKERPRKGTGGYSPRSLAGVESPGIDNPAFPHESHDEESTPEQHRTPDHTDGRRPSTGILSSPSNLRPSIPRPSTSRGSVPLPSSTLLPPSRRKDSEPRDTPSASEELYSSINEGNGERSSIPQCSEPRYSSPKQYHKNIQIGIAHSRFKLPGGGENIPGTNLPKFLPPPRPQLPLFPSSPKRGLEGSGLHSKDLSSLEDPQWTGLSGLAGEQSKSDILPSQVQAQHSLDRSVSAVSRGSSELDMSSTEAPSGGMGRLRRRFHDLLDDAFGIMQGQKPNDRVTPFASPNSQRRTARDVKSAVPPNSSRLLDELDGGDRGTKLSRPQMHLRPWSAAAGSSRAPRDMISTHLSTESGMDDSPRSAWGDYNRRSITPVNLPTSALYERPDSAPLQRTSFGSEGGQRSPTPVDPETGLRMCDPAVPLIRAIKEELNRFKSSVNTDSSTA